MAYVHHLQVAVPCDGATTPFEFAGVVYQGSCRVSVTGYSSNLPPVPFVAIEGLQVP